MEKNTAMKPRIDVALKFGIAPFQNDKETKTPVSLESNFSVPVKTYLRKKKNGGRKILLYSPRITAFILLLHKISCKTSWMESSEFIIFQITHNYHHNMFWEN